MFRVFCFTKENKTVYNLAMPFLYSLCYPAADPYTIFVFADLFDILVFLVVTAAHIEGIKKTLICVYSIYVLVLVPYVLIRRRQKFFVCLQSLP